MSLKRGYIDRTLKPAWVTFWDSLTPDEQRAVTWNLVRTLALRQSHDDNMEWVARLTANRDGTDEATL